MKVVFLVNKIDIKHILLNDLKKYLLFLEFEKNLSNHTIKAYWQDLKEGQ